MITEASCNRVYFSARIVDRFPGLWQELRAILDRHHIDVAFLAHTKDIWVRDFMPVQVAPKELVKFRYSPDYLRDLPNLITLGEVCEQISHLGMMQHSELIVDGGNVVGAPGKAIMTEKVFVENQNLPRKEVIARLKDELQIDDLVLIPWNRHDEYGHADGVVRFVDNNTVLMNNYPTEESGYAREVAARVRRHGLSIEVCPYYYENFVASDGSSSAVGCYVNYLRLANLIVVPAFGDPRDDTAVKKIESLFPGVTVEQVDCRFLARAGGVLNCASWTVYQS